MTRMRCECKLPVRDTNVHLWMRTSVESAFLSRLAFAWINSEVCLRKSNWRGIANLLLEYGAAVSAASALLNSAHIVRSARSKHRLPNFGGQVCSPLCM